MKFKKIVKEANKWKPAKNWWFDVPGAKYIYHGDWSDPEVQYMGFSLNYWDIEEGLLGVYHEEHPEDKDDKGFDAWMKEQGGKHGQINGELDNLAYAAVGENVEEKPWLGIKDAYRISEVYGQGDGTFVLYKDCLVDISGFDYYDKEYDDWFPYDQNPEEFERYYRSPKHKKELVEKLNEEVRGYVQESTVNEGKIGDAMKAGWEKVKSGAKKLGKAIGDTFKGPFRKGDQIVMTGENGDTYKGTIKDFDLKEKTYQVLLGNPVTEDTQDEVLEMGDRVDELDLEIDRLWRQLGDVDDKVLSQLILCCIEQEQLEPGRITSSLKDYASFNEESYDDRVDREYKAAVKKYQDERKKVKDRIRSIVGDEKADDVFNYWDRVRSSFNMAWRQDGFYGTCEEHLDRLADMLGPEGQDLIDDIQRKYDRSAKELSDYYATHDYTGD